MTIGELCVLLKGLPNDAQIKFVDRDGEDQVAIEIEDVGWVNELNSYVIWSA